MDSTNIKYFNLVQTDPKEFNDKQKIIRDEYEKNNGHEQLWKIMRSNTHNDIKKNRRTDYRLNETEINLLTKNKILIKKPIKNKYGYGDDSFGKHLLSLYQDDMSVFITSDMMLYAFHKFYDQTMEQIEVCLMDEFKCLCENLLNTIRQINLNNLSVDEVDQIKGIELYLLIPYFLLHYKNTQFFVPKIQPFLNSSSDVKKITESIKKLTFSRCEINKVCFCFDSSTFKPRGHYTNNTSLQNYFMAFTWFAKCIVKLNPDKSEEYYNGFVFSSLLAKIAEKSLKQVNKIETFVEKLIGKPDGYTLTSFLEVINTNINENSILLQESNLFDAKTFFDSIQNIFDQTNLTKKCELTKFGDNGSSFDESNLTQYCFSLIGKGTTYDNSLINDMVDVNFNKHTGFSRKFPSIFDITYAVFNNSGTANFVNELIQNPRVPNRDGIPYMEYLEQTKNKFNDKFNNITKSQTIYDQELIMLRALSKYPQMEPFNTNAWSAKQAQTQIGHYNEIRHDNVLYLDECDGFSIACKYEDIMIEPCVEFWNEYLNLITMFEELINSVKIKCSDIHDEMYYTMMYNPPSKIIQNFKNIVSKILSFLEYFTNGQQIPENLKEELMCILECRPYGSGEVTYTGWYSQLFYIPENCMKNQSEVSSYFSAPDDDRGTGGICHLGNGDVQLMYIIVNGAVYIGPVYTVYDIITPSNARYNDTEWSKSVGNYTSLNFNIE